MTTCPRTMRKCPEIVSKNVGSRHVSNSFDKYLVYLVMIFVWQPCSTMPLVSRAMCFVPSLFLPSAWATCGPNRVFWDRLVCLKLSYAGITQPVCGALRSEPFVQPGTEAEPSFGKSSKTVKTHKHSQTNCLNRSPRNRSNRPVHIL